MPHHDPDKWQLFKEYCKQDVVTEMEIERKLAAFPVPDFVQKERETDARINARGVAVDMQLVQSAIAIGDSVLDIYLKEGIKWKELKGKNWI